MRGRCYRCGGEQELLSRPRRVLLHALPELRSPVEIVEPFACANCGCEVRTTVRYVSTDRPVGPPETPENRLVCGASRTSPNRAAVDTRNSTANLTAGGG